MARLRAIKSRIIANGDIPFTVANVGEDVVIMPGCQQIGLMRSAQRVPFLKIGKTTGHTEAEETHDGYSA